MAEAAYAQLVKDARVTFARGRTLPVEYRKEQLVKLRDLISENEEALYEAVYKDVRRPKAEAINFETLMLLNEINTAIAEVKNWSKPTKVSRNVLQLTDSAYLHKDPLGVVLIIGAWNYPINLLLAPLIGAIAAGNCVILKPSEVSQHTAELLAQLIPKYLDSEAIKVVTGGVEETTALLKQRFDHIFYTGSTAVGKVIMRAAAEHLTPVTLELGGKCPVIVEKSVDLGIVARRVAWGKFSSCGQTCVGVDYLLCPPELKPKLIEELKKVLKEFYGDDVKASQDYCRFATDRHFDRVMGLLNATKGTVVHGGSHDKADLFLEPTIVDNVEADDPLMQEEIFGPILPIVNIADTKAAVAHINAREKPLALYMFSSDQASIDYVLNSTSSGNVTINDTMMHMSLDTLPFGGVGNSGHGRYHGKFSFDCFTHEKGVLHRPTGVEKMIWMRYPPFDEKKIYWAKMAITKRKIPFL
uniref:Aldehyde dehydrogenase n=1 Tax=Plectus sambesii TaxID=2011161 RepID=A0A914VJB9_9BILA